MTDTSTQFQEFLEGIELKQKQVDRIESARKSLSDVLKSSYGLTDNEVFVQGSYANGTAVRPVEGGEYDIDIVAVTADENDGATDAIRDLYSSLENSRYKNMIEERKPCVRVTYVDDEIGGFHVDVVPVRTSTNDSDAPYEAPRKGSGWHDTAPTEYTAWCASRGDDFRRTVRMFKRWRDEQQDVRKAVKSIVLQVLVSQYMPSGVADDADRVATAFIDMNAALGDLDSPPDVFNPVLEAENLTARWSDTDFANFKKELKEAADIAVEATDADNLVEACEKWGEIFGDAFPVVASEVLNMCIADRSHAKPPESQGWVVNFDARYTVRVHAQEVHGRRSKTRSYQSGGHAIFASPFNSLRFKAIVTGPSGVEIWWRVTNTGEHARLQSGLRGDFFKGKGLNGNPNADQTVNFEKTSYTGSHIIEAFALVGGNVVAKSEPFVVNIFSPYRQFWRP
ncbi:nucleotidyltransferase [Mycobacterium kansasii]|nr:nucleotidyltransferase [Mycobacterium attenuatum]ORB85962.1 nucleotidyltransferase [Mycobacterium kansasii]